MAATTTLTPAGAAAFEPIAAAEAVRRDTLLVRLGRFACLCAVALPITVAVAPAGDADPAPERTPVSATR